ncbi:hypothetical protein HYH02_013661 [Chlamydomonas schloesseri]|uniref:Uncharacterized protein n=1 Tax=Chlamydomonas schloesseri TaxID=2026947 RepID=A0A835VYL7_9CHLO|nr:hypothetical protein HYH02_013661 [Chlamydomonas schloesseri]|eukprot:KAG2430663.1 hypothetical protein HYH02_013661 [Chlamydomonas schloesseri]
MMSLRTRCGPAAAATTTNGRGGTALQRSPLLPVSARLNPGGRGSSTRSGLHSSGSSGSSRRRSARPRSAAAAATAAAAAAVRPGRGSRASTTSVVAFRDAHRAQVLLDTATEFCRAWMAGRMEGPSERVLSYIAPLVSDDVEVEVHGLMSHCCDKGLEGMARLLAPEGHRPAGLALKHWHCRVCAANEDGDVVFCLLELRAEDEAGRHRSCYQVLKLDMLLDETARRITRVLERGQWDVAGDGTTPLLLAYAAQHEREYAGAQPDFGGPASRDDSSAGEEEGGSSSTSGGGGGSSVEGGGGGKGTKEGAQQQRQQRHRRHRSAVWGGQVVGSDFPVERIQPHSQVAQFTRGLDPEALKEVSRAWCAARCSSPPSPISSSTEPTFKPPTTPSATAPTATAPTATGTATGTSSGTGTAAATTTGTAPGPGREALDKLLSPDFRLWDAYGLLPLVCRVGDRAPPPLLGPETASAKVAAPPPKEQQGAPPAGSATAFTSSTQAGGGGTGFAMALMMGGGGCVAPREAVYDIIENAKAEYTVSLTPLDLAASYTHNVVFNHWKCVMTPKEAQAAGVRHQTDGEGRPLPLEQECIEVDIFDGEGRLSDVWMFRDAFEFEKHLIRARSQQLAAEVHAHQQQQQRSS